MFLGFFFSCLCLDPHVFRLLAMFMLRSMFICLDLHAFCVLCLSFVSLLVCWLVSSIFACTHMKRGYLEQGCDFLGASKKGKDANKRMQAHKGQ